MWEWKISRDACGRNVGYKMVAFLSSVVYYFGDLLKSANMAFARHQKFISPWFDFSCHYRTVYNKETVTGEEILKSHIACLLTYKFPCVTTSASSQTVDGGKLCLLIWKEISVAPRNSLNALCFQKIRLENVVSTIHHQEIPRKNIICSVTVWPFFFLICICILFLAISSMYVFFYSLCAFPQIWK